jgi:hypothetical protein
MNEMSKVRAVVVAVPPDDPAHVVQMALALHRHECFEVSIIGCAPRSSIEALASAPAIAGGLVSGMGVCRFIDREREATQQLYGKVAEVLGTIPEDDRPQLDYMEGAYLEIITRLSTTFDLVVVPHPMEVPDILGLWFPSFDTCLALSKPNPTLFSIELSGPQRIIIAQIRSHEAWWATQILRRIRGLLDVSVHRWLAVHHMESRRPNAKEPWLFPGCDDIHPLDVATIPVGQQRAICLVVPARVVGSVFRFREVRRMLRRWQGSCLVWP